MEISIPYFEFSIVILFVVTDFDQNQVIEGKKAIVLLGN